MTVTEFKREKREMFMCYQDHLPETIGITAFWKIN